MVQLHLADCLSHIDQSSGSSAGHLLAARSAHNAAVSAITAAVSGLESIGAYSASKQREWLEYFEAPLAGIREAPSGDRVLMPGDLLSVARRSAAGYLSAPLELDMVQEFQFFRLTWLRNRVEHPRAERLSVDKVGLYAAIHAGMHVTRHCFEAVAHHVEPDAYNRVGWLMEQICGRCAAVISGDGLTKKAGPLGTEP